MLNWANRFNIFCYLDNQLYVDEVYECLLAVKPVESFDASNSFSSVDTFISRGSWYFGHLSYELERNDAATRNSQAKNIKFPSFYFFKPEVVVAVKGASLIIFGDGAEAVYKEIIAAPSSSSGTSVPVTIHNRLDKEAYIEKVNNLKKHILHGDCYEINFCQEFFSEGATIDPLLVFERLVAASPTPFSALYKLDDQYLLCASPERFIKKTGTRILSQPMKGTYRRDLIDNQKDEALKDALLHDPKERAENVMIVDLVRNDLSRICTTASITVNELFGVYTYPQVHQMVSTVSGILQEGIRFSDIINATFPMGSMTGAPKLKVMELIRKHEDAPRGLFSGSVGYIDPSGDFDFNVVIRSIFYNAIDKYVSFFAGSGITFYSDPEKEWEECLLKVEAIKKVLT
ncbi:MAG TPA: anthranilate synthase component I family protein [Chitinophagaceae bacterium]|nr:anthranilate synthase component I family protein [Chitinophagaceae bacterium]